MQHLLLPKYSLTGELQWLSIHLRFVQMSIFLFHDRCCSRTLMLELQAIPSKQRNYPT
jgi:hypothetical protein